MKNPILMKRIYFTKQVAIFILLIISLVFSISVEAQEKQRDFNSPAYRNAIDNITELSNGEINANNIQAYIVETQVNGTRSTDADEYITVSPVIDVVSWNGDIDAVFTVTGSPTNFNMTDVTFTFSPSEHDWIEDTTMSRVSSNEVTFTVNIKPNTNPAARSVGIIIDAKVNDVPVSAAAYIIQDAAPDVFFLVSPDVQLAAWNDVTSVFQFYSNPDVTPGSINIEYPNPLPDMIDLTGEDIDYTNQLITIGINVNNNEIARDAAITVNATINGNDISDDIYLVQEAAPDTFFLVTPENQLVSYNGNEDAILQFYVAPDASNISVEFPDPVPDWINTNSVTINPDNTIMIDIYPNDENSTNTATITVKATIGTETLEETATIVQEPLPEVYFFISPEYQAVSYNGDEDAFFEYYANPQITSITVDFNGGQPGWVESVNINSTDQSITINVSENTGSNTREAEATVSVTLANGDQLSNTITVYQYVGPNAYLLAAPREQTVSHSENDNVDFDITVVNVPGGWMVPDSTLPKDNWISVNQSGGDFLSLHVTRNTTLETRVDTIWFFANDDHAVYDSVFIYQYSTLDTFLIAAPREQQVSYVGNTIDFEITAVNLPAGWEVDPNSVQDWISDTIIGETTLRISVSENGLLETRIDTIRIFATGYPGVEDSVVVYQNSRPDPYLMAAPREHRVSHLGNDSVEFRITSANIAGWEFQDITKIPDWITEKVNENDSILRFKVEPNDTLATRVTTIFIQATDFTEVIDSVTIYQYSALDTFMLAAPRERIAHYSGDSLVFEITTANVPGGWEFVEETIPDWISPVYNTGDSVLSLKVLDNPTFDTRDSIIFYQAIDYSNVYDSVFVYQYARPTPYLLAAPRERKAGHDGETDFTFEITPVNLGEAGWVVDTATVPEWITVNAETGNDLLSFDITANDSLYSRIDTVFIYAVDYPDVRDSVKIYQYSGLDSYILAEPREQKVGYLGTDSIGFKITAVNLGAEGWLVDATTVEDWVIAPHNIGDILVMGVERNNTLETRSDVIYLYSITNGDVIDSVTVYQYAGLDTYILAEPREQKVAHFGKDSVDFIITQVNIPDGWIVDTETLQDSWITVNDFGDDLFSLKISENTTHETRHDTITIQASVNDTLVKDEVKIYQYSGFDAYILPAPREQFVDIRGSDKVQFNILAVNLDDVWEIDPLSVDSWINGYQNQGDTLLILQVSPNPNAYNRMDTIRIFGTHSGNTISDSVFVIQEAPSIILTPYAQDNILSSDTTVQIFTFSNYEEYAVVKRDTLTWYTISTDLKGSAVDSLLLSYNDTLFIHVNENPSSFTHRQAFIYFESPDGLVNQRYYIRQDVADPDYYNISGTISLDGNPDSALMGIRVIVGNEAIDTTDVAGFYSVRVLNGWRGNISPIVEGYYFFPESISKDKPINWHSSKNDFSAYPINPQVEFTLDTTYLCEGDTLTDLKTGKYPVALISGTYQQDINYNWKSEPNDPNLEDKTIINPRFYPSADTTKYTLEILNQGLKATATFVLIVTPKPKARNFNGDFDVCKNQAGVIYTANLDSSANEHFNWSLPDGGAKFGADNNTNIAIVNWGNEEGEYILALETRNKFGCSPPTVDTIVTISSEKEAPPITIVGWKNPDNMLYCDDTVSSYYAWGWFEMDGTMLGDITIIDGKNDWYCRLPEGHVFNPQKYHYFVDIYYDSLDDCFSRSFYNPPLDITESQEGSITVYPNPTDGWLNVKFNNMPKSQKGTLQLLNLSGQMVYNEELNILKSNSTISLRDVSSMNSGIYILRVQTDDYYFNTKIVVR